MDGFWCWCGYGKKGCVLVTIYALAPWQRFSPSEWVMTEEKGNNLITTYSIQSTSTEILSLTRIHIKYITFLSLELKDFKTFLMNIIGTLLLFPLFKLATYVVLKVREERDKMFMREFTKHVILKCSRIAISDWPINLSLAEFVSPGFLYTV